MSTRLEDMLRSSAPSRRPREDLHERIMAGVAGAPGSEPVGSGRGARLAPAALAVVLVASAVVVLTRGPGVAPAEPADAGTGYAQTVTRQVTVMESSMTNRLKDEASLLASDARRVYEGLKARLPLM